MFELTKNLMKRTNLLIALLLLAASSVFWKCGDTPPPPVSPQDAQLTKLSQTWKATSVTFGGNPLPTPTGYESFVLTASGTAGNPVFSYTTSGRPAKSPWPASGTFEFGTDFATTIKRDDGIIVTYSVTASQLQLTFNYTGSGFTARTGNVVGDWVFNFGL